MSIVRARAASSAGELDRFLAGETLSTAVEEDALAAQEGGDGGVGMISHRFSHLSELLQSRVTETHACGPAGVVTAKCFSNQEFSILSECLQ